MDRKTLQKLADKGQEFMRYETPKEITWCSNCGNFGIQNAIRRALVLEDIDWKDTLFCFDIGCNGNGSDKIEAYTIHGLHGRVINLAAGAKIANHKLHVIASAGDGATFSEGVNHLVHGIRNNYPMVFIHHNNENYGLTTGQPSALTRKGVVLNSAPDGVGVEPINVLDFVLALNPSFVARSYSGDVDHMTEMMRLALNHDGFAFIEVLQACPTYNRETPDAWYAERVKYLKDLPDYDNTDIWQARKLVQDLDDEIYAGLIYRNPNLQSFLAAQPNRTYGKTALVDEVEHVDVTELLERLR